MLLFRILLSFFFLSFVRLNSLFYTPTADDGDARIIALNFRTVEGNPSRAEVATEMETTLRIEV
jgi:hypothetical protein